MDFKDKLIALLAKETKFKKEEIAKVISIPPMNANTIDYIFR